MADDQKELISLESIPTEELRVVLGHCSRRATSGGGQEPDDKDVQAALATVSAWLDQVERELDPGEPDDDSEDADDAEFDPFHPDYGLCPECRHNDGLVALGEVIWGVCHRHRSRWEVHPFALKCSFMPDGQPEEEEIFRPVHKYKIIEAIEAPSFVEYESLPLYAEMLERDRAAKSERARLRLVRSTDPKPSPTAGLVGRIRQWLGRSASRDA